MRALEPQIASSRSMATGLSLLAWYVFASQCLSTLAAIITCGIALAMGGG